MSCIVSSQPVKNAQYGLSSGSRQRSRTSGLAGAIHWGRKIKKSTITTTIIMVMIVWERWWRHVSIVEQVPGRSADCHPYHLRDWREGASISSFVATVLRRYLEFEPWRQKEESCQSYVQLTKSQKARKIRRLHILKSLSEPGSSSSCVFWWGIRVTTWPETGIEKALNSSFMSQVFDQNMAVVNVCSLTFAAPVLVADKSLPGIDITSIGVITSIFPICYGFSKFISGVVSTKVSAQLMLGGIIRESLSSLCLFWL